VPTGLVWPRAFGRLQRRAAWHGADGDAGRAPGDAHGGGAVAAVADRHGVDVRLAEKIRLEHMVAERERIYGGNE
jgi:hypothetical protein